MTIDTVYITAGQAAQSPDMIGWVMLWGVLLVVTYVYLRLSE